MEIVTIYPFLDFYLTEGKYGVCSLFQLIF